MKILSIRTMAFIVALLLMITFIPEVSVNAAPGQISITQSYQTLWIIDEDGVLKNEVIVIAENNGSESDYWFRITSDGKSDIQKLNVKSGRQVLSLFVPLSEERVIYDVELFDNAECAGSALDVKSVSVKPVRKWKFYIAQDLHTDIGFTNPPQELIDEIFPDFYRRFMNMIEKTSSWESKSQFRFPSEQSFLLYGAALRFPDAGYYDNIIKYMKSGHISYPTTLASIGYGIAGTEIMARFAYFSERYIKDMTGVESTKVINVTDEQGITWAMIDAAAESGAKYFLLQTNYDTTSWQNINYPRVFYLNGRVPGNKILVWSSVPYPVDEFGFRTAKDKVAENGAIKPEFMRQLTNKVMGDFQNDKYPYDALLADFTSGGDNGYVNEDVIYNIKALNDRKTATGKNYVYPQFISSTTQDYFEYLEANFKDKIPEYTGGWEDYWLHGTGSASYESNLVKTNNDKLPFAEALATLNSTKFGGKYPYEDLYKAYELVNLWNEHTWGAGPGGAKLNDLWVWKRNTAMTMARITENIMKNSMDAINKNIPTDGMAITIYNSLSWERSDLTSVDASELPKYFEIIDSDTKKSVPYQISDGKVYFVAENVPGHGYKVFDIKERNDAPKFESKTITTDKSAENEFFKVTFDDKGNITSIIDKKNGNKELVDASAPYGFNQFIYMNTTKQKYNVVGGIKQVEKANLSNTNGPVMGTVSADGITGVEIGVNKLVRKVTLYDNLPRIDISNVVIKKEAPDPSKQDEEGFFVFPFIMEDFVIEHEMPSGDLNPMKVNKNIDLSEELLYGSASDFFTVNRWIDIGNAKDYGIIFSPVNSSLVQYNERASYRFSKINTFKKPYIYSWAFNNKWWTNYQKTQPGPVTFNYSIWSRTGKDFADGRADKRGQEVSSPLTASVIRVKQTGSLKPGKMKFIDISKDNVVMTASKMSEMNGEGLIFRFNETLGINTEVEVDLSFYNPKSVVETDMVENDLQTSKSGVKLENGKVKFTISGHGWVTIRVIVDGNKPAKVTNISAKADKVGTFVKWDAVEGAYYEVFRSKDASFKAGQGNWIATVNDPKYFDNQVKEETDTYYYKVIAVKNGFKSDESDAAKKENAAYPSDVKPEAPKNLRFDTVYTTRTSLTWDFAKDDVAVKGYILYRNNIKYKEIEPEHTSWLDYEVTPGRHYYYVRAIDVHGNLSEPSNTVYIDIKPGSDSIVPEYGRVEIRYRDIETGEDIANFYSYTGLVGEDFKGMISEMKADQKNVDGYSFVSKSDTEDSKLSGQTVYITYWYKNLKSKADGSFGLVQILIIVAVVAVVAGGAFVFIKKKGAAKS